LPSLSLPYYIFCFGICSLRQTTVQNAYGRIRIAAAVLLGYIALEDHPNFVVSCTIIISYFIIYS
jgi:hypothetical protein